MSRGSQWRRWDLHLHTPASYDYQNKSMIPQTLIDGLIDAGIEVIAITDHHNIDIQFITEMKKIAENNLTIFPGIELRSELGGSQSVHFIGIFPDDCEIDYVWTKLQGQLGLAPKDIVAKGGDQAIYVDFKEAAELIRNNLGGLITCHAGRKSGTIELIANATEFKQAIKKDLAEECIDILEIGRVQDQSDYQNIVFPHIGMTLPLIICSDNHNIIDYKVKGSCWIKADPTFAGLKQVLNEPENRVYLGDIPPCLERIVQNKTKYIDHINISKIEGSPMPEKWFDCHIPFHHGLVAIIGNKGSGKSALSDTLGLLGNSAQHESFSFLNSKKFRQPKNNKAIHFEAMLEWKSGVINKKNLNDDMEYGVSETVKYIPQHYLETICNELKEGGETSFDKELKTVIFSHVSDADRLGQESLDDLVAYRTSEINSEADLWRTQLKPINDQIASYDDLLTDEHKRSVEYQLQLKKEELKAHQEAKPSEVTKPDTDPKKKKQIVIVSNEIEQKQENIKALEDNIKTLKDKERIQTKQSSMAELLSEKIENFKKQYESFKAESAEYFKALGISVDSMVSVKIDREPLQKKKGEIDQELADLKSTLNLFNPDGPVAKKAILEREVEDLRNKLDEPNRQYQAYIEALEKWKAGQAKIFGDEETVGTIKHLEKQLKDLTELPGYLENMKEARTSVVTAIFGTITKLAEVYKSLYSPVQDFIENHPIAKDKFNLDFQVSIVNSGFEDSFFGYISHGVKGSFCGTNEGRKRLKEIVESADFESESGVLRFLDEIIGHLSEDRRQDPIENVRIKDQLRQGEYPADIYNFIFSLDYLVPKYTLEWSGKGLDQLSPGERGTLLLVFYLLIDKSDIPLIIDQPEENLDNQTVYDILVPCIKEVKTRRQIMLVTHNPNLAVVCDADQVIYASIDKKDGNRVDYDSGGIENPVINKHVVDVLEGTMPAFDDRDRKYHTMS